MKKGLCSIVLAIMMFALMPHAAISVNAATQFTSDVTCDTCETHHPLAKVTVDATTQVDDILTVARSWLGCPHYNKYCQSFVWRVFRDAKVVNASRDSAANAQKAWMESTSRENIPIGAALYFTSSSVHGHVGIYTGDGKMIHAVATVREETISDHWWSNYQGWGWHGGKELERSPITQQTAPANVTGISVSADGLCINVGETYQLRATVTPSNATNGTVSWKSSNTSVATVNSNGLVTAKKAGNVVITATAGGKSATSRIEILAACASHSYNSLGVCTKCNAKFNINITAMSTTLYATKDNVPVRANPYEPDATLRTLSKGEAVAVTGSGKNSVGNLWYRINDSGNVRWVFSGNLTSTKPTTTSSAPAAPTGLSAASASTNHNSARISWNSVSDAASYQVQYWSPANSDWRTDGNYSSGTSYTSTGLSANPSWTYRVRAVNSAGASSWSQVTYTKPTQAVQPTPPPVSVPVAPSGLSAASASSDNNSARISWNSVSGATSYQVQYWSPANSDWRTDGDYSSGTSYTSTGLSANSSWTYRVRAVNSAGASGWSQLTYTKPSVATPPSASNDFAIDGYPATRVERNMFVNVGAGSTLRLANAPTSNNTALASIPHNQEVYVYGVTVHQYPNNSGTNITWAKVYWNGTVGWVNWAWLR